MGQLANISSLKIVASALSIFEHNIVFIGGAVVELYCDDEARGEVRHTDDIDVVIELVSRAAHADFEDKLRQIGFQHDTSMICRFKYSGITVDIIPTDPNILSFSNRWYEEGINHTISITLDSQVVIKIFEVTYFLATKIEALKSKRHGNDFRANSDFEDIIYIFDNRTTLFLEIQQADIEVKTYLINEIKQLISRPNIHEEVVANLEPGNSIPRKNRILSIWEALIH